jgi:predicted nucleic acid-binding protein
VVSHPRVFDPPTPVLEGLDAIESLLASPSVRLLAPGPAYLELLREMLSCGATGNLVFDAQIAALCLENGARVLLTEDRDFARFSGLEIRRLETIEG